MSLPSKKVPADFPFKHSGNPDKYGQSLGGDFAQVQTDFDARAIYNQTQINETLDALDSITDGDSGADNIGATPLTGGTANTVQGILEELKTDIANVALGQIPAGSLTDLYLSNAPTDLKQRFANLKIVNVLDFGAVGDGITNDTAAIQNAINYGTKIYFPEGTYLIDTLYYGKDDLTLYGNNATLTTNNQGYLISPSNNSSIMKDVKIIDLTFKVNVSAFYEQGYLIKIGGVDGFIIENCNFNGWNGDAIMLDGTSASGYISPSNITIKNCKFDGINNENRAGITILQGTNIFIYNNLFKNITKNTMPGAVIIEPYQNLAGIKMFENINIYENVFQNILGAQGMIHFYCGIPQSTLAYPAKNINIINNSFLSSGKKVTAYQLNTYTSVPSDLDWVPNDINVKNNNFGGASSFYFYGIDGLSFSDNVINLLSGESYLGTSRFTPELKKKCKNIKFINNKINDLNGNFVIGDTENMYFEGNIVESTSSYATTNIHLIRFLPAQNSGSVFNFIIRENILNNIGSSTRLTMLYETNFTYTYTKSLFENNFLGTGITEKNF